ncbi:hypothetical protein DFA_01232 [Cavenderia fasciculata]|uniref:Methyltransferase type 11 domain-containing protein n=1 Tax=Cavenderia fasciculata TaxID=261658 RepID=F4PRL1_CACFS|nr:uncharacterized protein DFA_01232 [Cavenderia fasciculata]EGG21351.1 hypothetical protein DFA_01232 [Cavenderia fasciculata]|eukprot:XP_004359201.1 hypothetical protein DFA_01232 [Cavenderia fasciculata]
MTTPISTEVIQKKWDRFSSVFQFYNEPQTLPVCHILLSNLRLNLRSLTPPKAILEVACGAGAGSSLALSMKHDSTSLTSVDLSNEMVELTKKRTGVAVDKDGDESRKFKVLQVDAEKLPFADSTFDRYFANYCLHLVADPVQTLKETLRVLEKGGIACFSVWGRPQNSNQFTITKSIAESIGVPNFPHSERSAFHLNDIDHLRKMVLDAGFSSCLGGYTYNNALILNGKEYVEVFFSGPDFQDYFKSLPIDIQQEWVSKVESHVDELLQSGKMVGLETAYVVCVK